MKVTIGCRSPKWMQLPVTCIFHDDTTRFGHEKKKFFFFFLIYLFIFGEEEKEEDVWPGVYITTIHGARLVQQQQ
jgi:hypothetical protein